MKVVSVEGLREVSAALNKVGRSISRDVQRAALEEPARDIAARAIELAPKDEGDLRESITVSDKLSSRQAGLHKKVAPDDVEVFVGAGPLPQAHLQEYGTETNAAQPFMRPAWDAIRPTILERIKQKLWAELRK